VLATVAADETEPIEARVEAWLKRRWSMLVVAALTVFMFWTRMRPYSTYNQGSEHYFVGTDAYYHARHVLYTVHNFPSTLEYDPWTQFPLGTDAAQFGTLFDQIGALLVWIYSLFTGRGTPDMDAIMDVMIAYPALIGAAALIPLYLLARDLFDRKAGVFAAVAAALLPGSFLIRTLAGWPDHTPMEILLATLAVWTAYWSMTRWADTEVTLDKLVERPLEVLDRNRKAVAGSLYAALALWGYIATWSPGVLFLGILGVWLAVQTIVELARGEDPGPPVAAGVTQFLVLFVLLVPITLSARRGGFTAVRFSWMHPAGALLVALGVAAIAGLGYAWRQRRLPDRAFPLGAAGVGGLAIGLLALLAPDLIRGLTNGAGWVFESTLGWLPGIGIDETRRTIEEAQPGSWKAISAEFGWLLQAAVAGYILALIDAIRKSERRDVLLLVWGFVMFSGALTQGRFMYYLATPVVLLAAKLADSLFALADILAEEDDEDRTAEDRIAPSTGYAVVGMMLFLLLLPGYVTGFAAGCQDGNLNSWTRAGCYQQAPVKDEKKDWSVAAKWLDQHSPGEGADLTASYSAPPPNEHFDYPDDAYGILSWWDYGHIIEFRGERAPIANPFQQQAPLASEIFTAQDETEALNVLDEYLGDNEARYLMIDDTMVAGKFGAITVWADKQAEYQPDSDDACQRLGPDTTRQQAIERMNATVPDWFLQNIYRHEGDGFEHFRLVKEQPGYVWIGSTAQLRTAGSGQQQTEGLCLASFNRELFHMGHNRALQALPSLNYEIGTEPQPLPGQQDAFMFDMSVESQHKIFERVPGAKLTGQAPAGTTVIATVPVEASTTGRVFEYTAETTTDASGVFELTVPYSTTDPVPIEEGGTDVSVAAIAPYNVTAGDDQATVDVPDAKVLGLADTRTVRVSFN